MLCEKFIIRRDGEKAYSTWRMAGLFVDLKAQFIPDGETVDIELHTKS